MILHVIWGICVALRSLDHTFRRVDTYDFVEELGEDIRYCSWATSKIDSKMVGAGLG